MRYLACLLIITLTLSLQSCLSAVGVAAVGGVLVYKRKAVENFAHDQHIESKINNSYVKNGALWERNHIVVSSVNSNVLLAGEARTPALRSKAVALAKQVPGVHKVYNEISISPPISLWRKTKDAAITTTIKSKMLVAKNFDPSNIKVITNNGIVYLLGVVSPTQSDRAAEIASTTTGVKKVVKVFQYIT